ncbi:MAG: hypothetical protein GXO79_00480 [Chlorobi bacterium]|nr:hypothetical protein [Chlorobiota bacterium]
MNNIDNNNRSILDLLNYDLTTFFQEDDYEEVDSQDTPGMFMIDYEKKLPKLELNVFDTVQFRVFFDKDNITGSNPVNVKLFAKGTEINRKKASYVVDQVFGIYGMDDYEKTVMDNEDHKTSIKGSLIRKWTIEKGISFISIYYEQNKMLELNILFFNNLIKHTGKYLNIKQ